MNFKKNINQKCSVSKDDEILIIQNDWSDASKECLYYTLFFILIAVLFSSLGIFLNDYFVVLISLILLISIFIIPSLLMYIYNKNRIIEIKIDKSQKIITYKISSTIKNSIKVVKISEVESLIFRTASLRGPIAGGGIYSLNLMLKNNLKKYELFSGSKKNCKKLGKIVAEFLNKSLFYKSGNFREKII